MSCRAIIIKTYRQGKLVEMLMASIVQIHLNPWWTMLLLVCAVALAVVLAFAAGYLTIIVAEGANTDAKMFFWGLLVFVFSVIPFFLLLIWLFNGPPPPRPPG